MCGKANKNKEVTVRGNYEIIGYPKKTNKMKKIITTIILIISVFSVFSQNNRFETDDFIYWQPNTTLDFDDFTGEQNERGLELCKKYNLKFATNIQIHAILDVPKKKRYLRTMKEKMYICPVFCKNCSFYIEADTLELLQTQLLFDIAEYNTRLARIQMAELEKKSTTNLFVAALFPSIINKMYENMHEMFGSYINEVMINKKEGAYEEWKMLLEEGLKDTEEFATSEEECQRFINDEPFSTKYKTTYSVYGQN